MQETPTIPNTIYAGLPVFLKEITDQFDDRRERDIILTSSLTILSGCFTRLTGKYAKNYVSPNLFAFIVAPPSSGKGTMGWATLLGKSIHDNLFKNNKELKEKYQRQLKEWNRKSKKDGSSCGAAPSKQKYPMLFIPGNSSSAANYKILADSDGVGIIAETEADSLSGLKRPGELQYSAFENILLFK